jgi:hypothetical protein
MKPVPGTGFKMRSGQRGVTARARTFETDAVYLAVLVFCVRHLVFSSRAGTFIL